MAPLAGKHVLIIGGSSGIGFGAARASLAEGAIVTIASSSEKKVRAAAERLGGGGKIRTEVVNVAEETSVKALFEKIKSVDHLIFSVSFTHLKSYKGKLTRWSVRQATPFLVLTLQNWPSRSLNL